MSDNGVKMINTKDRGNVRFSTDIASAVKRWCREDLDDGNNSRQQSVPVVSPTAIITTGVDEIMNRVQAMKCAFGTNNVDHFCRQVQEYVSVLLEREKNRLCYKGSSPQLAARPNLVKLMMKIAEAENLTRATLHLAVYLYDRFADYHDIPVTQISLAAVTCIMIAGKLEERDTRTPKMRNLRSYLPPAPDFSFQLYAGIEKCIVNYFKWSFLIPNAYSFLEFFLLFVVDSTERVGNGDMDGPVIENNNNPHSSMHGQCTLEEDCLSPKSIRSIRSFAVEAVDLLLYDEPNDKYAPSLIAAATMMFARRVHGLHNWSHQLEYVTTYNASETLGCCDEYIIKVYERQSKCACFGIGGKPKDGKLP